MDSQNPLLQFNNSLQQPTECRETLYLLFLVYCKGHYKWYRWLARWKGTRGALEESPGPGASIPVELDCITLLAHGCIHQPRSSLSTIIRVFFFFNQDSIKYTRLSHWPLVNDSISSLSPKFGRWGRKFQPSHHMLGSSDKELPSWSSLRAHQQSPQ